MYQINPHAAMTDLYGVGKGEAQVFDTGIAERGLEYERRKVEADKLAKQKAAAEAKKKTSDLLNNKIGVVHPSDQPVFSKMQDQYAKNVLDAYKRGGGNLSVEDEANLNQQFNTMNQNALQSQKRFEAERKHLDEMDNPNNPFREREKTRAHTGFAQPSFSENGADFTPKTGATQIYDIEKNVVNPLATQVKAQVESNKIYGKTGIPFEASVAHAESLVNNAQVARELHEKALDLKDEGKFNSFVQNLYGSPTDEYGNKNPAYIPDAKKREEVVKNTIPENIKLDDMSKYLYTNRFVFKGQDFPPSQYGPGGTAEKAKPAVTEIVKQGGGEYVIDKTNLPSDKLYQHFVLNVDENGKKVQKDVVGTLDKVDYKTLPDGRKEVVGGTLIEQLPPNEVSAINERNKNKFKKLEEEVKLYDELYDAVRTNTASKEDQVTFRRMFDKYGGHRPTEKNKEFRLEPTERQHKLTPEEAKSFAFNKYGVQLDADIPSQARYQKLEEKPKQSGTDVLQKGSIVDGYKYLGGDTKNPKNWLKQ